MNKIKLKFMFKQLWLITLIYFITAFVAIYYKNTFCIECHAFVCIIYGISIEKADKEYKFLNEFFKKYH